VTRRRFLTTATLIAGAAPLASCSRAEVSYSEAVAQTWRPFSSTGVTEHAALQRELVRYATLAPSSHNTQCWIFKLENNRISIAPDPTRRCPAVDPDDHHLFVSLGCAAENLVAAGLAHGLRSNVRFDPVGESVVRVDFEPAKPVFSPLFGAIPLRGCSRAEYDGKPLEPAHFRLLEAAGEGNGVHVLLLTARNEMERVLQYVIQGNTAQMNDPAFMDELRNWIRFSDQEAVAKRDGLFSRASGNPSVPRWFAAPLFEVFFTPKGENEKYGKFIRSSGALGRTLRSRPRDAAIVTPPGRCRNRVVKLLATAAIGLFHDGVRAAVVLA
jgi:hypothetical protein